jgi:hypothetical protein
MNGRRAWNPIKDFLGLIPYCPEFYQDLRPEIVPSGSYALPQLEERLKGWITTVEACTPWTAVEERRRVLVIGNLKWWVEYGITLGLLLNAAGHRADLAYLPYRDWIKPVSRFDARRGIRYLESRLRAAGMPMRLHSLMRASAPALPASFEPEIAAQSHLDVQYTLQREDVDTEHDPQAAAIFALRYGRNRIAAANAFNLLARGEYDAVIIPNGSILEFGAVYRAARFAGVPTVTYEFGEQRQRVWIAQNDEVMRQDTSALWSVVRDIPLTAGERITINELFQARRGGRTWEQFNRQWQASQSEGAQIARGKLGLDPTKAVALLCTNVVGDSLALNRQIFSAGMEDWLRETVEIFSRFTEYQLVVRVHPGELLGAGHPSVEIVKDALPQPPEHVIVVPPESEINTYDLIELAHLGLVYTTTVGLEMSMHGVPVIVAGSTHYRGKGFTDDPGSWDEYVETLQRRLAEVPGRRLPDEVVDLAWRYAYRFFFDYPFPIPWHLISFWDDLAAHPLEKVLKPENIEAYKATVEAFVGRPIDWQSKVGESSTPEVPFER